MTSLLERHITTIKDAAKKLTGSKRRAFQAQVSIDYLNKCNAISLCKSSQTSCEVMQVKLTDVMRPFFKINELRFSEFATAIDSSERLRNIS